MNEANTGAQPSVGVKLNEGWMTRSGADLWERHPWVETDCAVKYPF